MKIFFSLITLYAIVGILIMTNDDLSQEMRSVTWLILVGLLYFTMLIFLSL